jgi:DNA-binding response OmpR family regulator
MRNKILIAEDDEISRRLLEHTLSRWGYEITVTKDGTEAWSAFTAEDSPNIAILDWMMPGIDGVEICRRVREMPRVTSPYIILLTAKGSKEDIVTGLEAGANDYITKPFDRSELRARVQVAETVVNLQEALTERVKDLEEALAQVKVLQGILPICSYCKNIRDDQNYWQSVENYISEHSETRFSHGICPPCYESLVEPQLEQMRREREKVAQ